MAQAPLGSGQRFAALKSKLAGRPGVKNPGALAAAIGRKKYGTKKFAALGEKGRARSMRDHMNGLAKAGAFKKGK